MWAWLQLAESLVRIVFRYMQTFCLLDSSALSFTVVLLTAIHT